MKKSKGVEVWLKISKEDAAEWSDSRFGRFIPGDGTPDNRYIKKNVKLFLC
jgi:hypothetical protein